MGSDAKILKQNSVFALHIISGCWKILFWTNRLSPENFVRG